MWLENIFTFSSQKCCDLDLVGLSSGCFQSASCFSFSIDPYSHLTHLPWNPWPLWRCYFIVSHFSTNQIVVRVRCIGRDCTPVVNTRQCSTSEIGLNCGLIWIGGCIGRKSFCQSCWTKSWSPGCIYILSLSFFSYFYCTGFWVFWEPLLQTFNFFVVVLFPSH